MPACCWELARVLLTPRLTAAWAQEQVTGYRLHKARGVKGLKAGKPCPPLCSNRSGHEVQGWQLPSVQAGYCPCSCSPTCHPC